MNAVGTFRTNEHFVSKASFAFRILNLVQQGRGGGGGRQKKQRLVTQVGGGGGGREGEGRQQRRDWRLNMGVGVESECGRG